MLVQGERALHVLSAVRVTPRAVVKAGMSSDAAGIPGVAM